MFEHDHVFMIAELSANHNKSYDRAVELVHAAKEAGADAVKLQTYTADTMTIQSDRSEFRIQGGLWDGYTLYDLYQEAHTPWEWQPKLKEVSESLGMPLFSTPFDFTAVDFLEEMNVPIYKIASFELVDIPLIRKVAQTGKPMIMSTGMASLAEIELAVETACKEGCQELALLKCTSAYPSDPAEANLKSIPHLAKFFNVTAGLSDHTMGVAVPIAAVALGAKIIEKHFTLSRNDPGPDSAFSLEPDEFRQMVDAVRVTEKSLGQISYDLTPSQVRSRQFRRSLYAVKDIKKGELFTEENIRSIRPGYGLAPKYYDDLIGKTAALDIRQGTPLKLIHYT